MDNTENNDFLYTSKKTKKTYNSIAELKADEAEWDKAHKAEIERAQNRKADAEKVETARKGYEKAVDEFNKTVEEAKAKRNSAAQAYYDRLRDFTKKWGAYHFSITNEEAMNEFEDFRDVFNWLMSL